MKYIVMLMIVLGCQNCASVSLKADKASIEVEGHKAEIEGLDLKTEKEIKKSE